MADLTMAKGYEGSGQLGLCTAPWERPSKDPVTDCVGTPHTKYNENRILMMA